MLETTTGLSNAMLTTRKGDTTHQRQQIKKWITTNGFANSMLQTDSESAILQLGEHVACELGLRFRASPPRSHQSNGAVERLHRTLFDQLRAVRLQWALSSGIQPKRLPQQSLPWLLHNTVCLSSISTWSRTLALLHIRTTTTRPTTVLYANSEKLCLRVLMFGQLQVQTAQP